MRKALSRKIVLSMLVGFFAGVGTLVFFFFLQLATQTRQNHTQIIWLLPFAGFFIAWLYAYYGQKRTLSHHLILEEIHSAKSPLPLILFPLVLVGTLLTHLFGGSAGREGTAVQMSTTLAEQIAQSFRLRPDERKGLLTAGISAGFAAALGTPLAGFIFGLEVLHVGRIKYQAWLECLLAALVGFLTLQICGPWIGVSHTHFPKFELSALQNSGWGIADFAMTIFWIALAGVIFGLSARGFIALTRFFEKLLEMLPCTAPSRTFIAGMILVLLFFAEGSLRYCGLGLPVIQESFSNMLGLQDPAYKTIFTALTLSAGFKGGEFIPLVFIGSTLGSALAQVLPIAFPLLASVGFAAVFAGAANAPMACTLMAIEIFGLDIAPFALVACWLSYGFSGPQGIYPNQVNLTKN